MLSHSKRGITPIEFIGLLVIVIMIGLTGHIEFEGEVAMGTIDNIRPITGTWQLVENEYVLQTNNGILQLDDYAERFQPGDEILVMWDSLKHKPYSIKITKREGAK